MSDRFRDGGPVFPSSVWTGMTLREWFAGQALLAHLSHPSVLSMLAETTDTVQRISQIEAIAATAYACADAMIRIGERHD